MSIDSYSQSTFGSWDWLCPASQYHSVLGRSDQVPNYIVLYKLTDQGIKDIHQAPRRIKKGIKDRKPWEAR